MSRTEIASAASHSQREGDRRDTKIRIFVLQAAGVALLLAAFVAFTVSDFTAGQAMFAGMVIAIIGLYWLIVSLSSMGLAVAAERKLRHQLLMHNMELSGAATKDYVTGLYNRRYFFERVERELQSASGFRRPVSLVFIDIAEFGSVNEALGYDAGDAVLTGFGRFIMDQTRASDVAARISGDEFAVLLPDTTEDVARTIAGRFLEYLSAAEVSADSATVRLTARVGISSHPTSNETAEGLLAKAESAARRAAGAAG